MAVFAVSFGLMGVGLLVVGLAGSAWQVALGGIAAGLGMGPSLPNFTTYFNGFLSHSQRGRGNGLLTMAFFAGQFASPLASAPLVATVGLPGAFVLTALVMGVVSVVMVLLAVRNSAGRPTFAEAR